MRGAPPVRVLCGPDARWHRLEQAVLAGSAATAVGWLAWQGGWDRAPLAAVALLAGLLAMLVIVRVQRRRPAVVLEWTGERWLIDARPGLPHLRVDLGSWLLLHVAGDGAHRWLALDLAHCGAPPHLVRAALFAHAAAPRRGQQDVGHG